MGKGEDYMSATEQLDFFYGNLLHLMNEAGLSRARVARELRLSEGDLNELLSRRGMPSLEMVYKLAEVLKVDVADLLRPGPQIGLTSGASGNYWVERTAEEYLANELAKSRDQGTKEPPSFDAVLSWWHTNDTRLSAVNGFSEFIELFEPPDVTDLQPRPAMIGRESLGARELGHTDPQELRAIFETADREIGRAVAQAHLEAAGGQPKLTVHTILINMASGNVVKLSYARLLLPVTDGDGHTFIMNYSKPIRRSEIGREEVEHFEPSHRSKPIIAGLV